MTKVAVFHPTDPNGNIIGGIESFIRGVIKTAPEHISYSIIGVTTNEAERPVGEWVECQLGSKRYRHYSVIPVKNGGVQEKIPLTARFMSGLLKSRLDFSQFDAIEIHRMEFVLPLANAHSRRIMFMHQNMEILKDPNCDIRWKHAPWLYYKLEDLALRKLEHVFCVREDAANGYKARYPSRQEDFSFLPTWVDTDVFYPDSSAPHPAEIEFLKDRPEGTKVIITVGRLDLQKNPMLLVKAAEILLKREPNLVFLWVGDGVLRSEVNTSLEKLGLAEHFKLLGQKSPAEIARLMQFADMFALPSAYEGMPICVLEALACGKPVVSTAVGEVPRILTDDFNGKLVERHTVSDLADAMEAMLEQLDGISAEQCVGSIQEYRPEQALRPLFSLYSQEGSTSCND